MEGESQEMRVSTLCGGADPSRKSSRSIQEALLCEKTAAWCESKLAWDGHPRTKIHGHGVLTVVGLALGLKEVI